MLLLVALASLLAGCVQAEIDIDVNEDGSGTASVLFAFDRSLLGLLGSLDESGSTAEEVDAQSIASDVDRGALPPGSKVEPYERGDFIGARVTSPFGRVEDVPALLEKMSAAISLPGDDGTAAEESESGFEHFAIQRTEDGWRLDAVVEPVSTEAPGTEEDDEFASALLDDASFTINVKLPGKVQEHNADEEADGRLTWKLDLQSTEPRTLSARTSEDSVGVPWTLVAGGGAGLAGLGVVALDVNRRRRRNVVVASEAGRRTSAALPGGVDGLGRGGLNE
jgi:hypothetical protein